MNIEQLFSDRRQAFWNVSIRYIRLMANSGLMAAVLALILIIGLYYQNFLDWLPQDFPVLLVLTVLFAYMLTRSPIRTFFQSGDLVYLLPLEAKLDRYTRQAQVYSWTIQSAVFVFVLFLLGPLYIDRLSPEFSHLLMTIAVFLVAKAWNIQAQWQNYEANTLQINGSSGYGFILSLHCLYWSLSLCLVLLLLMGFLLAFYYRPKMKNHQLKWDQLIELEEQTLNSFYRFANAFTDVPHLKSRVRKRSMLANQWERLHNKSSNTYVYLYGKTFARSGDYFGIFVRLAIVGALLVYATPGEWQWLAVAISVLFTYITGSQLVTIYYHHRTIVWPDLYPVHQHVREQSVQSFVRTLMVAQVFWLTLITGITSMSVAYAMMVLFIGLLLVIFYAQVQVPKLFRSTAS
ncbi:LOW QUALITY PROTEIN: ABC transporter, permease protein EscB [Geomicrobium sp. JCM 19037]|nr:LOW QUALITY PROTEIN: ABC transporter, permease protein EscB [Geomicrobium sp. JCM 19037]